MLSLNALNRTEVSQIYKTAILEGLANGTIVYDSFKTATKATGGEPISTIAGTVGFTILSLMGYDDGMPSLSTSVDVLKTKFNNSKERTYAITSTKFSYVALTDYKYLISEKPYRKLFINKLTEFQEKTKSRKTSIYNTKEMNELYYSTINNYVSKLKEMNINYNESKKQLNKTFDMIESNYK